MIGVSLLIASGVFVATNSFKEGKKKEIEDEKIIMDEIGNVYKTFSDKISEFSEKHNTFLKDVDDLTQFFADIPKNYENLKTLTIEYEKNMTEIDDMDSFLVEKCKKDQYYSDKEVNNNCLSYKRNKEKTINTFIEDIKYLNHKIESYNEWTDTANQSIIATTKYNKLNKIESSKYTDYVDLDGDQIFLGVNAD
jgi:hypothetical protein